MITKFLVDDWRRIVSRSWAFWFTAISLIIFAGSEAIYAEFGIEVNPYTLGNAAIGFGVLGMAGRLILQPRKAWASWAITIVLSGLVLAISSALANAQTFRADTPDGERATLALAVPFIAKWEGKSNAAYLDIIGVPTICYGSTRGVKLGMVKSDAECLALLRAEVAEYRHALHRYFTAETKTARLTPKRDTAFVALAFNIGHAGAGKSTATRRLNGGDIAGACNAITWFNKAGGRVVRGLINRRSDEYTYCMAGTA